MAFSLPDGSPITESGEKVNFPWLQWFSQVNAVVNAAQQSGSTADRPTRFLWLGRRYYDTDLGKPVFVRAVKPVVWRDANNAIDATFTHDPASLANLAGRTDTIAVAGAALGDYVQVAAPYDLQGLLLTAYVAAAGSVALRFDNNTGAAVDLASGTWKVRLTK